MSYDDEDDAQVATQSFGGLLQHVNKYKGQVNRLKKGHPSGISSMFGRAVDLLPEEWTETEELYEIGDSIFVDGFDVDALQEVLKGYFKDEEDVHGEEDAENCVCEEELSVLSAQPQEDGDVDMQLPAQVAEDGNIGMELSTEELDVLRYFNESKSETSEFDSRVAELEIPLEDHEAYAGNETLVSSDEGSCVVEDISDGGVAAEAKPDLHVVGNNGEWLWDIFLVGGQVGHVEMADGTTITKIQGGHNYVIVSPLQPGQRFPGVEIVGAVTTDCRTGNVYYVNAQEDNAVALLSTGHRIDQYKKPRAEDEYFVTELPKPGETHKPVQVRNVTVDAASGEVGYETMDGATIITCPNYYSVLA